MTRKEFLNEHKLPSTCQFSPSDWRLLASFWHPVARVEDITDKPVEVTLLDKSIVVFRIGQTISAADNHCPHRGAKLSLGYVRNDQLVCAYHGVCFDHSGACTSVPSVTEGSAQPVRMQLPTYPVAERYGLVWVCLNPDPVNALPEVPAFESSDYETFTMPPETWQCSALRHCENFNDTAHIPFIHDGTFGHETAPEIPSYKITETGSGFRRSVQMNIDPRITAEQAKTEPTGALFNYEYVFPFTSIIEISMPGDMGSDWIMDCVSPISAKVSGIFQVKARAFERDPKMTEEIAAYQAMVNGEDRPIVESQYPQKVPLDPKHEKHIPADYWSIYYRRHWKKLGLDQADPSA